MLYFHFMNHDQLWKELFTLQITDYTTDLFHDEIYYMDVLPTPLAMLFVIFSSANQPQKIYHYPTRGYPTTRLLSSLPDPTRSWKITTRQGCSSAVQLTWPRGNKEIVCTTIFRFSGPSENNSRLIKNWYQSNSLQKWTVGPRSPVFRGPIVRPKKWKVGPRGPVVVG